MDWFLQLENRRGRILFALLLLTFATLAVSSLRDPFAYDSFWHLKMGQDWLEKGLSPFKDHYSISHYGEEVQSPPYLFEVLLFKTVDMLGVEAGYKVLKFISMSLTVLLMMLWLKFIRAPVIVIVLTLPMLVVLLQVRAQVRPEMFAYPLLVSSLILYEWTRSNPEFKRYLAVALAMLFFANYHSAILGYVIFFGLFVDLGLEQIRNRASPRAWINWGIWGMIVVAVGFLNPTFDHAVIKYSSFSEEWFDLISEYQSPWEGRNAAIAYSLVLVATATFLLLFRQRLFGLAFVCAFLTWYAAQHGRLITPNGIVVVCLFALALSRSDLRSLTTSGTFLRRAIVSCVCLGLFVVPLLAGVMKARALVQSNPSLLGYFPDQLVDYMNANGKQGRIFNHYVVGGYLMYHLDESSRIYVDGRTNILYPVEHVERWKEAITNPEAMKAEIERLDIDFVVLNNRPEIVDLMGKVEGMHLDFADLRYSLYVKQNPNFPAAGALWSKPWCWDSEFDSRLQDERISALMLLPRYSLLVPITQIAFNYSSASDKEEFIQYLVDQDDFEWFDGTLRIAGYRALEIEMDIAAMNFFTSLDNPQLKDVLAMALASIRLNYLDQAEQFLVFAIRWTKSVPDPIDYQILHRLLSELQSRRPLVSITQADLDRLSIHVDELPSSSGVPTSAQLFCGAGLADLPKSNSIRSTLVPLLEGGISQ